MKDAFSSYKRGLREMLDRLGKDHPQYVEALTLQARLLENIAQTKSHGDTEQLRHDRSRIVLGLNGISLPWIGRSFNELCGGLPITYPQDGDNVASPSWITLPSFSFGRDLREHLGEASEDEQKLDTAVRGIIWAAQAIAILAATRAFCSHAVETVLLWSLELHRDGIVRACIHSHQFVLLREMWSVYRSLCDSFEDAQSELDLVKQTWNVGATKVPFNVRLYPIQLRCNGLTRQISLNLPEMDSHLDPPRTTNAFLLFLGRLAHSPFPVIHEIFEADVPVIKLLVYMHDHDTPISLK